MMNASRFRPLIEEKKRAVEALYCCVGRDFNARVSASLVDSSAEKIELFTGVKGISQSYNLPSSLTWQDFSKNYYALVAYSDACARLIEEDGLSDHKDIAAADKIIVEVAHQLLNRIDRANPTVGLKKKFGSFPQRPQVLCILSGVHYRFNLDDIQFGLNGGLFDRSAVQGNGLSDRVLNWMRLVYGVDIGLVLSPETRLRLEQGVLDQTGSKACAIPELNAKLHQNLMQAPVDLLARTYVGLWSASSLGDSRIAAIENGRKTIMHAIREAGIATKVTKEINKLAADLAYLGRSEVDCAYIVERWRNDLRSSRSVTLTGKRPKHRRLMTGRAAAVVVTG